MHIGLLMQGDHNWLGGVDYVRNLVLALGTLPKNERSSLRLTLVSHFPLDSELVNTFESHLDAVVSRSETVPPRTFRNRVDWQVRRRLKGQQDPHFTRFCQDFGMDFVYPYEGASGPNVGFQSAAWIPDFQHKYLPQFFLANEVAERDLQYASMAEHAPKVVLSSATSAVDFRNYYPRHAQKARVLQFAVRPDPKWYQGDPLSVRAGYSVPDRYFLICNQFWQHKNYLLVLEALKLLRDHGIRPEVVCTGHLYDYRQPNFLNTILQSIHRFGLNDQIRLLGVVPREHQIQLIRSCLAVIQPSLFEGWSTIIEFAKSLGRPLILSDLSVHMEQCPEGTFFDRMSPAALATKLAAAWRDFESGPNPEVESKAYIASQMRAAKFARNFLLLAEKNTH